MKKITTVALTLLVLLTLMFSLGATAFAEEDAKATTSEAAEAAEEEAADDSTGSKAYAAALVVAVAALGGAIAMGMTISKSAESIARQPEAAGKVNSAMMLGLVFVETLVIYALIVAILIIFVL